MASSRRPAMFAGSLPERVPFVARPGFGLKHP